MDLMIFFNLIAVGLIAGAILFGVAGELRENQRRIRKLERENQELRIALNWKSNFMFFEHLEEFQ